MKVSRRTLLAGAATLAATPAVAVTAAMPSPARVRTLNGRSLDWKMVGGVKEFRLVAEEVEHEFAPGCLAKCCGYNDSTPVPTIEPVKCDRVRILLPNRLAQPTTLPTPALPPYSRFPLRARRPAVLSILASRFSLLASRSPAAYSAS